MRKIIVILLIISLFIMSGNLAARTKKDAQTQTSQTPVKFKLKEPKLEKKSATDMVKTAGIVAGGVALGVGAYLIASPSEKEEKEKGLPLPPDWPSSH